MVSLRPIPTALVPVDSAAAERVSARNYDEYLGDDDVRREIGERPDCILRVTMAHCDAGAGEVGEGSPEALDRAARNLEELARGPLTRTVPDVLFVYEIDDPRRPGVRQIGLGGMASTREIRTEARPEGTVIRNEGIREEKARGRARLVGRTGAFVGTVNLAVEDAEGRFAGALKAYADRTPEAYRATDEDGCVHRVHLVEAAAAARTPLREALAAEPLAYVADGNHRSAAADMLGLDGYLAVFFPAATMGLAPYNRLVAGPRLDAAELLAGVREHFAVDRLEGVRAFQPEALHRIGLYVDGVWYRLVPGPGSYDPGSAVDTVDADIVQRRLFGDVLGIADPRDDRLTFVGAARDAHWLALRVDAGDYAYAVTLPPVTMAQFVRVCRQGRLMPPKSTWFRPKLRMGLVVALLER